MKMVKIRIHRMWILTFKIRRMQMRVWIEAFILSVETQCTGLGQLNDCDNMLFPSVHISAL